MTRPLLPPVPGPGPWVVWCGHPDSPCVLFAQTRTITATMNVLRALVDAGLNPRVRSL
jgi:hypothetical protein